MQFKIRLTTFKDLMTRSDKIVTTAQNLLYLIIYAEFVRF